MSGLVLHPVVEKALQLAAKKPSHALLIIGASGIGKEAVARQLAAELLAIRPDKLDSSAAFIDVSPATDEPFGIDKIRQAQHAMTLRAKTSSKHANAISRVVLLPDAHTMTREAQNALLKLLEEPPKDGAFILTAPSQQALLPTIASRCQVLHITKPEAEDVRAHFAAAGHPADAIELAMRMADGLPGQVSAMLDTSQEHPLAVAATTARQLVQQTAFERLCQVDGLSKKRQQCLDVCYILQQMAHLALQQANAASAPRWKRVLTSAFDCQQALERRVNTKLALTQLMLSL